jgi:hypothetical protein
MKMPRIRTARLALLAGGVALSAVLGPAILPAGFGGSVAHGDLVVSINLFQRELSPYGRWARDRRYGDIWYPHVRQGWRPYYDDGHWVYSDDYGWLWVAEQPWGWAPFHYGRWVLTDYGWAWVPGTVWGPAWVTFRSAPDYIGWAPLPPEADWYDGYGFRHRYEVDDDRYWSFVRPRGFLERRFDRYAYDRRDNRRFIQNTTNITNITIVNNRVVNRGIDVNHVERETHRRVRRVKVSDSDRPDRTRLHGNSVVVYKPVITDPARNERLDSGAVTNDQRDEPTKKRKRRGNLPAENVNQGDPAQQFVAPNGQAGDTDQLPTRKKKKRNFGKANRQQFAPENQMQPSAGGDEMEQLPVKKKKKRDSGNANINGGAQQPQTFSPNNGGAPEGGDQVPRKKKRQKQQFGNQQQFEQQPQIQRQQRQRQQQDQQNNTNHRQKNKQNNRQCQQGDAAACGN